MKRAIFLATVALLAMLVLMPIAGAQETTMMQETMMDGGQMMGTTMMMEGTTAGGQAGPFGARESLHFPGPSLFRSRRSTDGYSCAHNNRRIGLITFNAKIIPSEDAQRALEKHHARAEKANPADAWHRGVAVFTQVHGRWRLQPSPRSSSIVLCMCCSTLSPRASLRP